MEEKDFNFPYPVWARIIYDYIIFSHKFKNILMETGLQLVIESIIPLYFGFIASFVKKTKKQDNQEAEKEIENICLAFEKSKPYLVANWERRD